MNGSADMTFCLGEGNAGYTCPKREECRRYRYRHTQPVDGTRLSYTTMACRGKDFDQWIPVKVDAQ